MRFTSIIRAALIKSLRNKNIRYLCHENILFFSISLKKSNFYNENYKIIFLWRNILQNELNLNLIVYTLYGHLGNYYNMQKTYLSFMKAVLKINESHFRNYNLIRIECYNTP